MTRLTCSVRATTMFVLALSSLPAVGATGEIPGPLTVQVRSAANDQPVGGVTVHVGGRMAVSDQTGRIVFDGVPAGTYEVRSRQPGHQDFRQTIELKTACAHPDCDAHPRGAFTPQAPTD